MQVLIVVVGVGCTFSKRAAILVCANSTFATLCSVYFLSAAIAIGCAKRRTSYCHQRTATCYY